MSIRNRVVGVQKFRASDLKAHPKNWRLHPPRQREAMMDILSEVGDVGVLTAMRMANGDLTLLDGHLRADLRGDDEVEVAIVDLNEQEAELVLATYDPLAALAVGDSEKLAELLAPFDDELTEFVFDVYPMPEATAEKPTAHYEEKDIENDQEWMALSFHVPRKYGDEIRRRIYAIIQEYDVESPSGKLS